MDGTGDVDGPKGEIGSIWRAASRSVSCLSQEDGQMTCRAPDHPRVALGCAKTAIPFIQLQNNRSNHLTHPARGW